MKENKDAGIRIRLANIHDKPFVLSLIPRLAEFGPPRWRDADQMTARDSETLDNVLSINPPETVVFIAEDENDVPLGFIHLRADVDYFSREKYGHVSDIVITAESEGRGVGRALMIAGENWARSQGYRLISLHAFIQNVRARKLYESLGYGGDMLKYVKEL
ncbi:MAG TPA: GNAT family N-acetyltransferase [Blastocatellia bacterium]|nr:GNAT family N-acetyltransferase [Blastocatellia bacterium]